MSFVNSEYFREAAVHFKKYGRYADGDYGTYEWEDYWTEEERRVLNGFEVGGARITGKHYLYLNYLPIKRIDDTKSNDFSVHKNRAKNSKKVGKRVIDFPDFWDEDYILFHTWDIAKYGLENGEKDLAQIEKFVGTGRLPIVRTEDNLSGGKNHLWLKPRGVGAPQPITEPVMTPEGERQIGDLEIGDLVYGRNGKPTRIEQIHEQGVQDTYQLTFSDGRTVRCGLNHTWTFVYYRDYKKRNITVEEILTRHNGLFHGKESKFYLPRSEQVAFEKKDYLVHPFWLGCILTKTHDANFTFHVKDISEYRYCEEIFKSDDLFDTDFSFDKEEKKIKVNIQVKNKGSKSKRYNDIIVYLRKKELINNLYCNRLPNEYKYGSINQRKDLIRGYYILNGSRKTRTLRLYFYSKLLAKDFIYIIRSLGYNTRLIEKDKGYSIHENPERDTVKRSGKFKGYKYAVEFTPTENSYHINPEERGTFNDLSEYSSNQVGLVKIEKLKYKTQMRCIGVDNEDHLYLTRDFIPTHNSWKGAVLPVYNQFFFKDTVTFLVADREKFLKGDGLFTKYLQHVNSLNKYGDGNNDDLVSGFKRAFLSEGKKEMEYKTGYIAFNNQRQKIEKGKRSLVKGVIIDGDPNNIRGNRGDFVYEEFGSFREVDETWQVARSSTEEDGIIFATQYGFGTGGDEDANIEPLTKMFNDPKTYNILEFENVWDKDFMGMRNAYFTPAYISIAFKDENGNSKIEDGKEHFNNIREELKDAQDARVLPKHKAEKPYTPAEALSQSGSNIFPTELLNKHMLYLINSGLHKKLITTGKLESKNNIIIFKPDFTLDPYIEYPVTSKTQKTGAVCILHTPFKFRNGTVPLNMYRIAVDPYRHDTTTGDSIGSISVIENINNITPHKGDKIVAWYDGRPEKQDEFNEILFFLAMYYNCKIAPENDEPGGIIDYAKTNHLRHLLEPEFELAYDVSIQTKKSTGKVGMHIASGKNDLRKKQGDKYIQEWLLRKRGIDSEGNQILNLHTIYNIGLLKELIEYNDNKNADRVAALRINMYYEREFIYKSRDIQREVEQRDLFFEQKLFA